MATPHNHPVVFGRKIEGCLRCDELKAGAPIIAWRNQRVSYDQTRAREIRSHDCKTSRCGVVCTFGDY